MPELVVQGFLIAIIVASLAATWSTLAPCWRSWRWRIRAWRFVALRSLEEKQARGRLALRRAAGGCLRKARSRDSSCDPHCRPVEISYWMSASGYVTSGTDRSRDADGASKRDEVV